MVRERTCLNIIADKFPVSLLKYGDSVFQIMQTVTFCFRYHVCLQRSHHLLLDTMPLVKMFQQKWVLSIGLALNLVLGSYKKEA